MIVQDLLAELARRQVRLRVEDGNLVVQAPPGVVGEELAQKLRDHKTALVALLTGRGGDEIAIQPAPDDRHLPFPMTDMQHAYWVGRSAAFEMGNVACQLYFESQSVELKLERLEHAWNRLVERHDMLRCVVRPDAQLQILPEVEAYRIEIRDLRRLAPADIDVVLTETRAEMSHKVAPTDRWPLFEIRASLLPQGIRLHFRIEVLIADGRSIFNLFREWGELYANPGASLPPLHLSYRDVAIAQDAQRQSPSYQQSYRYWMERLSDLPPAPLLPPSHEAPTRTQQHFVRRSLTLDEATWGSLSTRGREAGLTQSSLMASAYGEILRTFSKSTDFSLNVTVLNRPQVHPDINRLVGDFTITLLLAARGDEATFIGRARALHNQLASDLEHAQFSAVRVIRELVKHHGSSRPAMMPIIFTSPLGGRIEDSAVTQFLGKLEYCITQTPQLWLDHQVSERDGELVVTWDAVDAQFAPGLLDQMFESYRELLMRLARDDDAWTEAGRRRLPSAQRERRKAVNDTTAPVPSHCLHQPVLAQARRHPDKPAVIATDRVLTYGELSAAATKLARQLRVQGVRPNQLVAVAMEKGWEQVVAVVAILYAGAAYLPVDPALPIERISHLLTHGEVKVALTKPASSRSPGMPDGISTLAVDEALLSRDDEALAPLADVAQHTDLAYVIYTSGSTGLPKGVMIDHRGAFNTIADLNRRFDIGAQDRVLALSSLSFDLSVYDIFGVLGAGGSIVMPEPTGLREPAHWAELMQREGVTLWNSVPALMEMLVEYLEGREEPLSPSLRLAWLSGDWIPVTLPDRVRHLQPGISLVSMGGATEASIWSILHEIGTVDPTWRSIPYGRPMKNQSFHVLDQNLESCPDLVSGELFIGGMGVAKGYWRDPRRTADQFITHPRTGESLYRTGDLGRYLPDGNIEFLGREDSQVKIRGHRIELGEIEATLRDHPRVRSSVVIPIGPAQGHRRLVAYVVPDASPANAASRAAVRLQNPSVRSFPSASPIVLPSAPPVDEAYYRRRTRRVYETSPVTREKLAELLSPLRGIFEKGTWRHRYPSASSIYAVQTYLYIVDDRAESVDGGYYYYDPHEHRLLPVDCPAQLDPNNHDSRNRAIFESSAFSIFLVGHMSAIEPLYGEIARDLCMLEAGTMTQLLMETSPACGIGLCPIGGMNFDAVAPSLSLMDGDILLHSLVGGCSNVEARTDPVGRPLRPLRAEDLREHVGTRLPEAMVPAAFVLLDELPMSSNGKIDRNALPAPDFDRAQQAVEYVAPTTSLQRDIAAVWSEVLELPQVGIRDNFFDLGGDSVLMVSVHRKLTALLGREFGVVELFQFPTVEQLASHFEASENPDTGLADRRERAARRRDAMASRRAPRSRRNQCESS